MNFMPSLFVEQWTRRKSVEIGEKDELDGEYNWLLTAEGVGEGVEEEY